GKSSRQSRLEVELCSILPSPTQSDQMLERSAPRALASAAMRFSYRRQDFRRQPAGSPFVSRIVSKQGNKLDFKFDKSQCLSAKSIFAIYVQNPQEIGMCCDKKL